MNTQITRALDATATIMELAPLALMRLEYLTSKPGSDGSIRGYRVCNTRTGRTGIISCDHGRWLNGTFVIDVYWPDSQRRRSCGTKHLVFRW